MEGGLVVSQRNQSRWMLHISCYPDGMCVFVRTRACVELLKHALVLDTKNRVHCLHVELVRNVRLEE